MFPSEVSKWTVAERDHRPGVVTGGVVAGVIGDHRVETKSVEVADQSFEGGAAVGMQRGAAHTFVMPDGLGIAGPGVEALRHRQRHTSEHGHRWRFEAECWGVGRQRVAVLRPADVAPTADLDVDEADVTHAFEVGPHRVGVEREQVGDLGGDQRSRCSGQFEVDRIARVIAECLEEIKLGRTGHVTRLHGRGR